MFRQILTNTSRYSLAVFASRAVAFLLLPVYTRYLTPADYGVMALLDVMSSLVGMLVGSRLGQGLFYFYFAADTKEEKDACLSTALVTAAIMGGFAAGLGILFSAQLSLIIFGLAQNALYLQLALLGLGFSLPLEVGFCIMRTLSDSLGYLRVSLFHLVIGAALNLLCLAAFRMGIRGMLVSAIIASAAISIYLAVKSLSAVMARLDWKLMGRFVFYSLPLTISSLAAFLIHYGDRVILRAHIPLAELGIYSLAYKFGMLIASVHMPFVMHWNAQVIAIVRGPGGEQSFSRSCTYLTAVLATAVVGLSLFIDPLLRMMTGRAFASAGVWVPWIAFAYLIRAMGAHLQSLFTVEGKPGIEARVNVVGGITCTAAYFYLIPRFQVAGAIAATTIGFLVILLHGFWEAQRLRPFSLEYRRLSGIMSLAALIVVTFRWVCPADVWSQVGVAIVFLGVYLVTLYLGCFERSEREAAIGAMKALLRRSPVEVDVQQAIA